MPLRTGRQVPIGNTSSLTMLGVEPVDRSLRESHETEQGYWVHFVAHIQRHEDPAYIHEAITHIHARAIWKFKCPNISERPHTTLVFPHDGSNWMRVMYRRRIEGQLHDPKKFLHNEAKNLKFIWELVQYAELGGAIGNTTFLNYTEGRQCPIQPCEIRVENETQLGFGRPEVKKVAHLIFQLARAMSSWGPRSFDLLVMGLKIPKKEAREGLQYLIDNDFLADGQDGDGYMIREKFVVHCWRAFLHS